MKTVFCGMVCRPIYNIFNINVYCKFKNDGKQ